MKKFKVLSLFIISMFFLITNVKAKVPMITCNPTSVFVGENITCSVKTEEKVEVTTKLNLVAGNTILESDGNIVYKAQEKGEYEIVLQTLSTDAKYVDKIIINVKEKTTTTTTTTKEKSSDCYLSWIKVDGVKIKNFIKSKTDYTIELNNDVIYPNITVELNDSNAKYEITGPDELSVGENEYKITVTAQDETTKVYKLLIIRKDELKSSDTSLKSLNVSNYNLNFDDASKTFYLTIKKDDNKLNLKVVPSSSKATYEIEGNKNLKNDSIIKITVTAEDGSTDLYRIIIRKNETNNMPYVYGLIALLLIICLIIFIVIRKRKNKNNINKKEEKNNIENETTIEAPKITDNVLNETDKLDDDQDEDYYTKVDNDEEEKTVMLSYAEEEELKEKSVNEELKKAIDEFDNTYFNDND